MKIIHLHGFGEYNTYQLLKLNTIGHFSFNKKFFLLLIPYEIKFNVYAIRVQVDFNTRVLDKISILLNV